MSASCLQVTVTAASSPLTVKPTLLNGMVMGSVTRVGESPQIRCGLVCTVASAYYLDVKPEVIWLLPESFSTDVVVYSNVTWHIE